MVLAQSYLRFIAKVGNMTRLEAIRSRLKNATPGPWGTDVHGASVYSGVVDLPKSGGASYKGIHVCTLDDLTCDYDEMNDEGESGDALRLSNAELIAHAPDDLRTLLACVDEMRGALNAIACWDDGDVGFHMDEPASAHHARETLASIEEKLR